MDITLGSAVYSRAGRDKGGLFIVVRLEAGYAYLADGDTRRCSKSEKEKNQASEQNEFRI